MNSVTYIIGNVFNIPFTKYEMCTKEDFVVLINQKQKKKSVHVKYLFKLN